MGLTGATRQPHTPFAKTLPNYSAGFGTRRKESNLLKTSTGI